MKKKINNILFTIGVLSVVVMLFSFDISFAELLDDIRRAGYWLPCCIVLWLFLYLMNAVSWRTIIQSDGQCRISFPYILRLTVSGFALNYVTPVGVLGGEPYRIMELSEKIGAERATSSVLLFSMMHIFSHFWYWITAIITFVVMVCCGLIATNTFVNVVLSLTAVFCLMAIYFFCVGYRKGMVVGFFNCVSHIPGLRGWSRRFIMSHQEKLSTIDRQIAALHSQNKRAFAVSLALEYVGRILQSLEIMFILLMLGIDGGGTIGGLAVLFLKSFLILAFTSLFANILGFIPMQAGGREGGFAMSVAQLGMTGGVGLFVGIICRVREIFWICVGLLLMKK